MLPTTYVALDLETTDRDPTVAGIVEIGLVRVEDGDVVDTFSAVVNPGVPCSPGAAAVHGITDAEIAAAAPVAEVLPEVAEWLADGGPVVAYNGPAFDRGILRRAFEAAGFPFPGNPWVDPLPVARALLPAQKSHKLGHVGSALGIVFREGEAHRALGDLRVLVEVVAALRAREVHGLPSSQEPPKAPPPPPVLAPPVHGLPSSQPAAPGSGGIVSAAIADLEPLAGRVAKWIAAADALPCATDDDERRVLDAIRTFKDLERDAVKLRTKHTEEIGKQKREVEAEFRARVLKPIEAVVARLEDARRPLALERARAAAAERQRIEAEAERIAEEARLAALAAAVPAEDAQLQALLAGDTVAAAAAATTAQAVVDDANEHAQGVFEAVVESAAAVTPAPVVTGRVVAHDRVAWRVTVIAPDVVPRHLCSPDEDKIRAAIEAAHGATAIPGVVFEVDVVTTTRTRRG